jgi:hypothetical protein
MDIGALLFSLAMVVLVAAYVLQPLRIPVRGGARQSSRQLSALKAERDRVLDSIQEIDMDHTMGKVPEEDYQKQRQALVLEGAEILRQIDKLQPIQDLEPASEKRTAKEMELEAAIAQLRGKSVQALPQVKSDSESGACPDCGEAFYHGDRFCSNCGASLEEQVA